MIKTKKDLDLKILIDNDNYVKEYEEDNNESITPTTDKGYFSFTNALKKIKPITTQNQDSMDKTHETSNISKEEISLVQNLAKHSNELFVKKYQYNDSKTSSVLRFGINKNYEDLISKLETHNNDLNTTLRNALSKKTETKSNISNISGATKYAPFREKYIELTNSENLVIKHAIEYLEKSTDNIALIDIFPREFNKKNTGVGTINTKKLDTHTAILYKTIENKILVLDPNNPMFSSHVSKYKGTHTLETLCSTNPSLKIYSRPNDSETGFAPEKYRDCIDIAVKIAFVLNNSGDTYKNLEDIMNSQVIKLITNNVIIDGVVLNDELPTRIKQISNFGKIIEHNINLKLYNEKLKEKQKIAKKIKEDSIKEIEGNYLSSLSVYEDEHKTELLGLENIYQKYCEDMA